MDFIIYLIFHGFIFAGILTSYLLATMILFSPRIWGMSDYPKSITEKVPPQTRHEKRRAAILFIPFLIIGLGYPIFSTLLLEIKMGGNFTIFIAFINIFGILMFGNIADFLILDLLIVGTITPRFVILPGTEDLKETEYKEFRKYHAKGHVKGTLFMAGASFLIALLIVVL